MLLVVALAAGPWWSLLAPDRADALVAGGATPGFQVDSTGALLEEDVAGSDGVIHIIKGAQAQRDFRLYEAVNLRESGQPAPSWAGDTATFQNGVTETYGQAADHVASRLATVVGRSGQVAAVIARARWAALVKSGLLPAVRGLGNIGLAIGAFQLGWHIGSAIDSWFGIGVPASGQTSTGGPTSGMLAVSNGDTFTVGDAPSPATAPSDGFVLTMNGVAYGHPRDCPGGGPSPRIPIPSGFDPKTAATVTDDLGCQAGTAAHDESYWFMDAAPLEAQVPGTEPADGGHTTSTAKPTPPAEGPAMDQKMGAASRGPVASDYTGEVQYQPEINPGYAVDPAPAPTAPVPDCAGLTYDQCAAALEQAGFATHHQVVYTDAQADLTKPASVVVVTKPAAGAVADHATDVEVDVNPATMPVEIPAPAKGTTVDDYTKQLTDLGLQANPTTLAQPNLDYGPNEVIAPSVAPSPGARADPGAEVSFDVNPSTAPALGSGPAGGCSLTAPSASFDFSPVTSANLGGKVPFSLVGWLGNQASRFSAAGAGPSLTFTLLGSSAGLGWLDHLAGPLSVLRTLLALLLWLGVAWWLYGHTIGKEA